MKQPREHRWSFRTKIETEVILHYSSLGVMWVKMRDVSFGGMCVETRPLVLNPSHKVRVTFLLREGVELVHRSVEALVVYTNRHGCGIMFDDIERDLLTSLRTLMQVGPEAAAG